tara:strand:+ start:2429 stop:3094 length:666 start_codon:yes stop_codon:yes gene_type:complete
MNKDLSVVLLGAGQSKRFQSSTLKQNYIIHNKRVIDYSIDFFRYHFRATNKYYVINKKINIKLLKKNEHSLYGSTSRLKSLNNCLDYILRNNLQTKYTLIHDIARPVLDITDVRNILKEIKKSVDGSSLGYPLTNAIKELKNGKITENIIRSNLWSTFTPQIFKTNKLYESIKFCIDKRYDIDDDIEALIINNLRCSMVLSNPCNIKITYKSDIENIKKLL